MEELETKIIKIKDKDGITKDAEVVLYFSFDNKKFVIYTLNETDENGMVILYSSLVEKEGTETVFKKIAPEDWTKVKQIMNKVVKEGRE